MTDLSSVIALTKHTLHTHNLLLGMLIYRTIGYSNISVEPLNKGRYGDKINLAVLSSTERLPSFKGSQSTKPIRSVNFEQCPLCRGS